MNPDIIDSNTATPFPVFTQDVFQLPSDVSVSPSPSDTFAGSLIDKADGFFSFFQTGGGYESFAGAVKIVFLGLSIIFLGLAIFSYIKAHLLIKSHSAHSGAGHGGGHGAHGAASAESHPANLWHRGPAVATESTEKDVQSNWDRIKKHGDSIREAEWKLAVIEADNLVDDALKSHGFSGESMGERLMIIKPDELNSLQELWDAHKLRNLLVHEAHYEIRHEQVLAALHSFEKVLRELGVIT